MNVVSQWALDYFGNDSSFPEFRFHQWAFTIDVKLDQQQYS